MILLGSINSAWESTRKTRAAIFAEPVRANVKWKHVESLLASLGAEILEGSGSRIRVELNGVRAVFHRPHPKPDTNRGALVSVRRFIEQAEAAAREAIEGEGG